MARGRVGANIPIPGALGSPIRAHIDSLRAPPLLTNNVQSPQIGPHAENGGRDGVARVAYRHEEV